MGSRITNQRFNPYPNWDDLRFPAQGINPPGQPSDPNVSTTDGSLIFSASNTNIIAGIAQMPHGWAEGTTIKPHIHWYPVNTNAGDVLWRFEYEIISMGDVPAQDYTADDLVVSTDVGKYSIDGFSDLTMTGRQVSDLIAWKVSRIGGDALDTYAGTAHLYEFDIHYQIDSLGSEREFLKYTLGE